MNKRTKIFHSALLAIQVRFEDRSFKFNTTFAPLTSVFVLEIVYHGHKCEPIEAGARSKKRVYCRSLSGIAGSNSVRGRNVILLSVLLVVRLKPLR
jgi:hypothetical protein